MDSFKDLNDNIVYSEVKSRSEALALRDDAKKTTLTGKNVAIIFEGRYHLYFAPGFDPYQVRKDIDNYINKPEGEKEVKTEKVGEDKKTPERDASGKFVSKKKISEETASSDTKTDSSKKKGFWDKLK